MAGVGKSLKIEHVYGCVVNYDAKIDEYCNIDNGVTIGDKKENVTIGYIEQVLHSEESNLLFL